jgi:hypothetical protein
LRFSRGLGAGCAALVGLVLLAAGATTWFWARLAGRRDAAVAASMPAGWVELVRRRTIVPASAYQLAPPRDLPSNGADALWDTTRGVWRRLRLDSALARVSAGRPGPRDLAARGEIEHDPVLDRWAQSARSARWSNLRRMTSSPGSGRRHLFDLRQPRYGHTLQAMEILALRGWLRAGAGDTVGARADFAAVVGIGIMLVRHEPTLDGFLTGRAVVHYGAEGLAHLAARTRDTALARRARDVSGWSAPSTATSYSILIAAADSSLAMARDTALSLGWRTAALMGYVAAPLQRPTGILFGMPRRVLEELEAVSRMGDAESRAVATLALETARAVDRAWPLARWWRYRGSSLARRIAPSIAVPAPASDSAGTAGPL